MAHPTLSLNTSASTLTAPPTSLVAASIRKFNIGLHERLSLGRRGWANAEEAALEVSRFAGNRPTVSMAVGLTRWDWIKSSESLSNSGNGMRTFDLKPGLYRASDVLYSGERRVTEYFVVGDGGIADVTEGLAAKLLGEMYPAEAAQAAEAKRQAQLLRAKAEKLALDVLAERKEFTPETRGPHEARPIWRLDGEQLITDIVRGINAGHSDDRIVADFTPPSGWLIDGDRHGYHNSDAALDAAESNAIRRAQMDVERKAAVETAAKAASVAGWPALTGSDKQIAWAEQIREAVAAKDQKLPALKKASKAKYWIDNYRDALRRA